MRAKRQRETVMHPNNPLHTESEVAIVLHL